MTLMISPTEVFIELKLSDSSLFELLPLKDKNKNNQVSDSGSWTPIVYFLFGSTKSHILRTPGTDLNEQIPPN